MILKSSPSSRSEKTHFASLILVLIFAESGTTLSTAAETQTSRPNVLVILTDDQGWGDLSLHGNPNLSTPNIDSLARDGAQLKNFYVCAVCSPTRAEFLTGRYHTRMGVFSTSSGGERFDLDERTIGDVFQAAGYATAAFGKWHSGMQPPYHPNARGFDEFYGFCSGHWGNYFSPMLERNGEIVRGEGFIIDDFADHAIEFMRQDRKEPFFVYLPLNTPHSPMQVPDEDWAPFENKDIVSDPVIQNSKREDVIHSAGISRSNKWPNSSYLTDWANPQDHIDWRVNILAAGVFDVQMRYVCPKSAVGTEIRLELHRENLPPIVLTKAMVAVASDTNVIGKQYDRTPQMEGYDKDWGSMSLGQIALPKGTGTLRMKAPKLQGDQGIEMRLMMFERLDEKRSGS